MEEDSTILGPVKRAALVLVTLALAACQPAPVPAPTAVPVTATTSGTTLVDLGDGVHLAVTGTVTSTPSLNATCADAVYAVKTSDGTFQALAIRPGCPGTTDIAENGDHGFYPTAPPRALVDHVATPVGDAIVFANQYSECTSSCYMGTDQVALVPVGSKVIQVIAVTAPASGTIDRDRAGLVAVLQGLRRA